MTISPWFSLTGRYGPDGGGVKQRVRPVQAGGRVDFLDIESDPWRIQPDRSDVDSLRQDILSIPPIMDDLPAPGAHGQIMLDRRHLEVVRQLVTAVDRLG